MMKKSDRADSSDGKEGVGLPMQLSIGLIALVLIGGAIAGISMFNRDDAAQPDDTGSVTTSASSGEAASGFGPPDVDVFGRRIDVPNNEFGEPLPQVEAQRRAEDPDWLTAAPAGTQERGGWQRVTGAVVPFSTSDGPTAIVDGVPVGWAHTPQGCALAAAWVIWEVNARPGDRTIRERALVSTPADLAQFDRDRAAGKIPDRAPLAATRWMLAFDAFQIKTFSADLCVVGLASRAEDSNNGAARWIGTGVSMVWDGSAWRLRVPAGGNPPKDSLSSLAGWTPW
ncbi:hypothetical protein ACFVVM_32880 [Nocardia sp. NPDC058176]|uniref:hypothetical protein n=1 Tax=Nocardia sp. NPDC058176 TaxID=3346368 RepID=UPI0036DCEE1B